MLLVTLAESIDADGESLHHHWKRLLEGQGEVTNKNSKASTFGGFAEGRSK